MARFWSAALAALVLTGCQPAAETASAPVAEKKPEPAFVEGLPRDQWLTVASAIPLGADGVVRDESAVPTAMSFWGSRSPRLRRRSWMARRSPRKSSRANGLSWMSGASGAVIAAAMRRWSARWRRRPMPIRQSTSSRSTPHRAAPAPPKPMAHTVRSKRISRRRAACTRPSSTRTPACAKRSRSCGPPATCLSAPT